MNWKLTVMVVGLTVVIGRAEESKPAAQMIDKAATAADQSAAKTHAAAGSVSEKSKVLAPVAPSVANAAQKADTTAQKGEAKTTETTTKVRKQMGVKSEKAKAASESATATVNAAKEAAGVAPVKAVEPAKH